MKFSIFPVFLILVFSIDIQAQVNQPQPFITADSAVKKIERINNVRIFYNPLWFEGKEIHPEISDLPVQEAVSLLARISGTTVTKLRENHYVLVPQTAEQPQSGADSLNFYHVGDIMNYGSKNTAVVHGTVINGSTGEAIIGARVNVSGMAKWFETDRNGRFTMNIAVGEHTLKAVYPGFEESNVKVKVYSDGNLTIELYIKSIMLDEVSVTSVKIDQYYRRTKMSVMSFDVKTIKELPGNLGEKDVIKGLSLLPGVQTTGEFGAGFNVRGGSSDQNLVLIEDVPVFNTSHLFGLTSIVNPDGISDATLYKGGIPANYGERASSILSIRMDNEQMKKAQVKGGIGLINSRLSVDIPVGNKLKISAGGRTSYSDWMLKKIPDPDLSSSSAGFNDFNLYISWNVTKRDKVTLFGYTSNDRFSISGMHNYQYGNKLGSLAYSHRFSSSLFTSVSAGVSSYEAALAEKDSLKPSNAYKTSNSLLYRNMKWNWIYKPSETHVITFGTNAFLYTVYPGELKPWGEVSNVIPEKISTEQGFEWAAYLGDDYKISDKLSIEAGLRYSGFFNLGESTVFTYREGVTKSEESIIDTLYFGKNKIIKQRGGLEPRFSIRYNLNVNSSVRMSFNRINQYISLISATSVSTPTDLWKLSDKYIKPLVSDQIAVGYFRETPDKRYEYSAEAYYKLYRNVIDYKNGASVAMNHHIETELVTAEGRSIGIELYGKKNMGKITGWVSYTLSNSVRRTISDDVSEQINKNNWFPDNLDRLNNLVINGSYTFNKRWKLGLTFSYITGRPVTLPEIKYTVKGYQIAYYSDRNKYKMPDYHRLDLSISRFESLKLKKKWKGYWTFSVMNLYGQKNAYSIFYQRDRSPFNFEGRSGLYKLYIIGRPLPTFTYNFLF